MGEWTIKMKKRKEEALCYHIIIIITFRSFCQTADGQRTLQLTKEVIWVDMGKEKRRDRKRVWHLLNKRYL